MAYWSIHLHKRDLVCAVVLEAPAAQVLLFTNGDEVSCALNLMDGCDCLSMKTESGIDLLNLVDCHKDDSALVQSKRKEPVSQVVRVFNFLSAVLILQQFGA